MSTSWHATVTVTEQPLSFQIDLRNSERGRFTHSTRLKGDRAHAARLLAPLLFAEHGARSNTDQRPILVEMLSPFRVANSISRALPWINDYFRCVSTPQCLGCHSGSAPANALYFEDWLRVEWHQAQNTKYLARTIAGDDLQHTTVAVQVARSPQAHPERIMADGIRPLISQVASQLNIPLNWRESCWFIPPTTPFAVVTAPVQPGVVEATQLYRCGHIREALRVIQSAVAALPPLDRADVTSLLIRLELYSSLLVLQRACHNVAQQLDTLQHVEGVLQQCVSKRRTLDDHSRTLLRAQLGRCLLETGACLREAALARQSIRVLEHSLNCLKNTDPTQAMRAIEHIGISKQLAPQAGHSGWCLPDSQEWADLLGHATSRVSARLWPTGVSLMQVTKPRRPRHDPQRRLIDSLVGELGGIEALKALTPGTALDRLNWVHLPHILFLFGQLVGDRDIQVHAARQFAATGVRPATGLASPELDEIAKSVQLQQLTRSTPKRLQAELRESVDQLLHLVPRLLR